MDNNKITVQESVTPKKPKYHTGRFITSMVFLIIVAVLIFLFSFFIVGIFEMSEMMSDESINDSPLPGAAAFLGVLSILSFIAAASAITIPIFVLSVVGFLLALFSANHLPSKAQKVMAIVTCVLHGITMSVFTYASTISSVIFLSAFGQNFF